MHPAAFHPAVPAQTWEFPVDDGRVVVRPDLPCLFYINSTAYLIWQAYRESGSHEYAANILVERFGISPETAAKDVTSTVDVWARAGLLGPTQSAVSPRWTGRHGEASAIAYCSIQGTTFLLLTDSPEMIAEVLPRLDGIQVGACTPDVTIAVWAAADDLFAIVVGDECVAFVRGVGEARAVLFQELVRRAGSGREWLALLHAGACGIDGRCVLFPASSYSGKSTLAAALMASGFTLYGDDFIGVEAGSLQIPAMPFAIAVRHGSWDVLRSWIPEIESYTGIARLGERLKFVPATQGHKAGAGEAVAIVFSEWVAGADISLKTLSTADVIARLNASGFWIEHDRDSIGAFLAWLERLPKFALRYGDLANAVAHVRAIAATGIEPRFTNLEPIREEEFKTQ
ncbi:MAG: PqqD family peptide modification chaperone [Acidobacteriaceae bacterium]|nr:PqqD family peptide modification chaperone [Acidobacteriaceae bacterium]